MDQSSYRLLVTGLVQGVGFRPFIHRLAGEYGIHGQVENRNDGVVIEVCGTWDTVSRFRNDIALKAPAASSIQHIEISEIEKAGFESFRILESENVSDRVTEISPDIAVCGECLADMKQQHHRIGYPLINCSFCGPRFSIIRDLPYDRRQTTMDRFEMCAECRSEYENIEDRRFHAQPVACNSCGPVYTMETTGGETRNLEEILNRMRDILSAGEIVAVKGTGGYNLVCDALSSNGVSRLRKVKHREGKPFALMVKDVKEARRFAELSRDEEAMLVSWRRPIVLLRKKGTITAGIADGLDTLGIMLPYMPFHYLVFERIETGVLVMTSGNLSDEPIIISDDQARIQFKDQVNGIIAYNREIYNRVDDSVTAVLGDKPVILRRARGYTPSSFGTGLDVEGILGCGAELTGSFCMGKGNSAIMSQYTGDLKNLETYDFYREIYSRFCRLFRFTPGMVVGDLHPDYLSSRFAAELSEETGIPRLNVQHHHAHIAAGMLCAGLEGEVLGFSFDGTGLGSDGHIWGSEVIQAGYMDFLRLYHFEYIPMPGGERAIREPWRMAVSYLVSCYGRETVDLGLPINQVFERHEIDAITALIEKQINTPLTSSAGRLFDAVAALAGLNYQSAYQAQAPMLLESAIDHSEKGIYRFEMKDNQVSFYPMIRQIVDDLHRGGSPGAIAAKFHNTLIELVRFLAIDAREHTGLDRVVLGGGTFQNRYLVKKIMDKLEKERFEVYLPDRIPVNDQGISAGQLAIGAERRKNL